MISFHICLGPHSPMIGLNQVLVFLSSGHFDRILIRLFLRRDIYFYLMEYYVPLALVVSSSWISFWIDYRCTPARATLPVTTFLTLNSMAENLRARDAGSQSYSTALEIYINACSFYVFAALIEYAIVGITDHMWHKVRSQICSLLFLKSH